MLAFSGIDSWSWLDRISTCLSCATNMRLLNVLLAKIRARETCEQAISGIGHVFLFPM